MLLKSIELINFRQFKHENISFANGKDGKNVTLIIGENGTGKTTFAQAFFWCMYGKTLFSDKQLLNRLVANALEPGQNEDVRVVLVLEHGEVEYTLIRSQNYRKESSGKLIAQNVIFDIDKKSKDGRTESVKKLSCESTVNSILPSQLSKYFFFDGERIEKMSKDISNGTKANDFADAVKGLLGLDAMNSAIQHLSPSKKNSVIGYYDQHYDESNNNQLAEYTRDISKMKTKLDIITQEIETKKTNILEAKERKKIQADEIKKYEEAKQIQIKKEGYERDLKNAQDSRKLVYKQLVNEFNSDMKVFFSKSMIQKSLEILANEDFAGVDIPAVNIKTIQYLLKRERCLCGEPLKVGTKAYDTVYNLADYLPPKEIGSYIGDFKNNVKTRVGDEKNLMETLNENMTIISKQTDDILGLQDTITELNNKLNGSSVLEEVNKIQQEITTCDKIINQSNRDIESLSRESGELNAQINNLETKRGTLALQDEKNRTIEIYKAYAEKIYEELLSVYNDSEKEIRERLETTINEIFNQIYNGDLSLSIDEKYHISVYVNSFDGDVETSTAQSISVIFAFITGIIKMAKEKNVLSANNELLTSEPYPLVMDAPLSAFDKRRIKTVCETLPTIAEQVIIFIKDTDGELAEEYMGDRIGTHYFFAKHNEFETSLESGENNV